MDYQMYHHDDLITSDFFVLDGRLTTNLPHCTCERAISPLSTKFPKGH